MAYFVTCLSWEEICGEISILSCSACLGMIIAQTWMLPHQKLQRASALRNMAEFSLSFDATLMFSLLQFYFLQVPPCLLVRNWSPLALGSRFSLAETLFARGRFSPQDPPWTCRTPAPLEWEPSTHSPPNSSQGSSTPAMSSRSGPIHREAAASWDSDPLQSLRLALASCSRLVLYKLSHKQLHQDLGPSRSVPCSSCFMPGYCFIPLNQVWLSAQAYWIPVQTTLPD